MFDIRLGVGLGHSVSLPAILIAGLMVGYIAGMFGMGGGFLLTPMLMYIFKVPAPFAVGSGICQQCGTSIASFIKYRHLKRGEPRIDLVMLGGSLLGVDAGTRLLGFLDKLGSWQARSGTRIPIVEIVLDSLFILVLSMSAFYMIQDAWRSRLRASPRGDLTIPGPLVTRVRIPPYIDLPNVQLKQVSVPMMCYLGFGLGLASGLMGIGGGVIFMPILLFGFGLSIRNAAGTGVLLLFVTVVVGTLEQAWRGRVSLILAMVILVGSSIGSQLGAMTTHRLMNRHLRLIFGMLVLFTVVIIAWDLSRLVRQ